MFYSSIYGLTLSCDLPIPGLVSLLPKDTVDLRINTYQPISEILDIPRIKNSVAYSSEILGSNGKPSLIIYQEAKTEPQYWLYHDGIEVVIELTGRQIWLNWPPDLTFDRVATYLLGPILGFVTRLWGYTSLHGGAIGFRGYAVALLGNSGVGKSTTVALFAESGYPVLSEDVVTLTRQAGRYWVQPGYSFVRLWPETVATLYGSPDSLPRLIASLDYKHYLDVAQPNYVFQREPLPLGALLLLERSSALDEPIIEEVSPSEKAIGLIWNGYNDYALTKMMRSNDFELYTALCKEVPIHRIISGNDSSTLSTIVPSILKHLTAILGKDEAVFDKAAEA